MDVVADSGYAYLKHVGGQFTVLRLADGRAVWMIDGTALSCCFDPIFGGAPGGDGHVYAGGRPKFFH